ncbi:hypothetical protein DVH24_007826 [Malus domestica]|uniref:Uncharacterized protein n=1 Tax=Malus domestica TaxID=3750 RepID=A0A498JPV8_MALDO|nr:hypothetical protein DVH24_007826 [Malus domestica]
MAAVFSFLSCSWTTKGPMPSALGTATSWNSWTPRSIAMLRREVWRDHLDLIGTSRDGLDHLEEIHGTNDSNKELGCGGDGGRQELGDSLTVGS